MSNCLCIAGIIEYLQSGPSWGITHPHLPTTSILVCSVSVVVTAYDFESGRLGSSPEWGLIYYKASITAQGLPEPSSAASDSTLKQLTLAGYQILVLYFIPPG